VNESTIFGMSIRALLALIIVTSGLAFLYIIGLFGSDKDVRMVIINGVFGIILLAVGFYFGQKSSESKT
jgi:hypothetical protein